MFEFLIKKYHTNLTKRQNAFRWDHLTEKFAYERRIREAKLRAAMIEVRAMTCVIPPGIDFYSILVCAGKEEECRIYQLGGTE